MKILIVDDEASIRKHLLWMLDGSEFEVWEAENGRDALHILENTPIDILLTDIRMPVMDGMELIQQCKIRHKRLWSIVLSNYAEFELAQQALKYGAKNYLLKATISKETLILELKMAYEDSKRLGRDMEFDTNEMLMVQNSLFYERFHRHISTAELVKRSIKLNASVFQFEEQESMFAFMEADRFAEWCSKKYNQSTDLAIYALMNVVLEVMKQFHPGNECFHLGNARFVLLDLGEDNLEQHTRKLQEIQRTLQQYLQLDVSLISGYRFTTLHSFFETARDSESDIDQLFYSLSASLLTRTDNESARNDHIDLYSFFQSIEMETDYYREAASNLPVWIESFFELIRYLKRSPSLVKDDLKFLLAFIEKRGYSVTEELRLEISRSQAIRLSDYKEIFERWLNEFHNLAIHRKEIVNATHYIHEHYKYKITIDDICSHVNLSRSHLSKLFKDNQGVTVIEYVEGFRMKQARVLLRTTPLSISEISEKVGINDIFYFSKLYKRYYKVNPSKDRNVK